MRVKTNGKLTRIAVHDLIDQVFDLYGREADYLTGLNLYFTPHDKQGIALMLVDAQDQEIPLKDLSQRQAVRSVKPRSYERLAGGSTIDKTRFLGTIERRLFLRLFENQF